MVILTDQKQNVLAIPQRAVLTKDNTKYVRVVTNNKTKAYKEQEVKTGLVGDGGVIEIVSGLNQDQEIVTFIATKK